MDFMGFFSRRVKKDDSKKDSPPTKDLSGRDTITRENQKEDGSNLLHENHTTPKSVDENVNDKPVSRAEENDKKLAATASGRLADDEPERSKVAKRARYIVALESSDSDEESSVSLNLQHKFPEPTIDSNGIVNFAIEGINPYIICKLCGGYFREPFTITECLHTYCKSCIFLSLHSGVGSCPTCDTDLRPDPYKRIRFDRTMNDLVHKIFPSLEGKDIQDSIEFYERRGIKRKNEKVEKDKEEENTQVNLSGNHDNPVNAILLPDKTHASMCMPSLEKPHIRAPGKMKMSQIKKYIAMKIEDKSLTSSSILISCKESIMGDELNLNFIRKTRWDDSLGDLVLTYRMNDDAFF